MDIIFFVYWQRTKGKAGMKKYGGKAEEID
jgi:hypothetical protein